MNNHKQILQWFSNTLQQETKTTIKEINTELYHDLQQITDLKMSEIDSEIPKYFIKHYIDKFCHLIATRLNSQLTHSTTTNITKHITPTINPYLRKKYISHECELHDIIPPDFLLEPSYSTDFTKSFNGFTNYYKKLAFIDLETDSLDIDKANILQISIIIPNEESYYILNSFVKPSEEYRINENSPSFKVNRITQKNIENARTFDDMAVDIAHVLYNTTLVGFNIHNYDLPILTRHFLKSRVKYTSWTFSIDLAQNYWKHHRLTLENALKEHNLDPIVDPHNALSDASACIRLLSKMIEKQQLPNSFNEMINFIEKAKKENSHKDSKIIRANFNARHPWISKMWRIFPSNSPEWKTNLQVPITTIF
jgi:DNA polymerase III epsilon subunit-like protein